MDGSRMGKEVRGIDYGAAKEESIPAYQPRIFQTGRNLVFKAYVVMHVPAAHAGQSNTLYVDLPNPSGKPGEKNSYCRWCRALRKDLFDFAEGAVVVFIISGLIRPGCKTNAIRLFLIKEITVQKLISPRVFSNSISPKRVTGHGSEVVADFDA